MFPASTIQLRNYTQAKHDFMIKKGDNTKYDKAIVRHKEKDGHSYVSGLFPCGLLSIL